MNSVPLGGIIAATLTPVTADLQPDGEKAVEYYRWLLAGGCNGLNVLGTTGEAMSLSALQRFTFMQSLAQNALPLERMMVGTGAPALRDTINLTRAAIDFGFAGVLVMPPAFYRDVTDDGVLAFFDSLARSVAIPAGRLYLYNFPQITGIVFTAELVRRISNVVPVAGLKDSSNSMDYMRELHAAFPDLRILPSSESVLPQVKRDGFAGCISGTVALWPHFAAALWAQPDTDHARFLSEEVADMRATVTSYPLIGAVRALVALERKDDDWLRCLPPLRPLERSAVEALQALLKAEKASLTVSG